MTSRISETLYLQLHLLVDKPYQHRSSAFLDEWRRVFGSNDTIPALKIQKLPWNCTWTCYTGSLSLPGSLPALFSCLLFGILTVLSPGNIFIVFHRKRCSFFLFFSFDRETIFHLECAQEYFLTCHYLYAFIICLQSMCNSLTYFAILLACIYFLSPLLEYKPSKSHDFRFVCLLFFASEIWKRTKCIMGAKHFSTKSLYGLMGTFCFQVHNWILVGHFFS